MTSPRATCPVATQLVALPHATDMKFGRPSSRVAPESIIQATPFQRSINESPTATQVAALLDQTAAELDGILAARGFQLPVPATATGTLRLLELFNAKGAYALAERFLPALSPSVRRVTSK